MRLKTDYNMTRFSARLDDLIHRYRSKSVLPEWVINACDDSDRLFDVMVANTMMANTGERTSHCYFKVLNNNGKCIAPCSRQLLKDGGIMIDCIGIESLTTKQYFKKIDSERKLH